MVNHLAHEEIFLQYDFFLMIFDIREFEHELLALCGLDIQASIVCIESMNFQVLQLSLKQDFQMSSLEPVLHKPELHLGIDFFNQL